MDKPKILLAGASGYLGNYIAKQLLQDKYEIKLLVRNVSKLQFDKKQCKVIEGELTKPESIKGCCDDVVLLLVQLVLQDKKMD